MKRLLVIHNNYQNLGGEDIAVKNELEFLKKHYLVDTIFFENQISNYFYELKSLLFSNNNKSNLTLEKKIKEFKPDIVYVHNTWFTASLGIFNILKKENITTILKIHNFRYFCTSSIQSKKHLNGNDFCPACGYKPSTRSYFNKYFDESLIKSFFVLLYGAKYIKILKNSNFKILVLTKFHKNFIAKMFDFKSKIYVFPNSINFENTSSQDSEKFILYAGRISKEKGITELIDAFLKAELGEIKLKIVGEGPLLADIKSIYKNNLNVEFIGLKDNIEVLNLINNSIAVVSATRLYEGQPTLLCEASSLGVASIFPRTGGVSEYFPQNYQLSFEQFQYDDLVNKIKLVKNKKLIQQVGAENKKFIIDFLDEEKLYNNLNEIIND